MRFLERTTAAPVVIHGGDAVAELKPFQEKCMGYCIHVIHGGDAVAELKLQHSLGDLAALAVIHGGDAVAELKPEYRGKPQEAAI